MTAMPIHAPRVLIGWRDLLSWASHISGDSCYLLLTTLPLSHFVPKLCDKADKSQWSENRIGKEVTRDGKGAYPQELCSEYQSKGSHFSIRFELGTTDSYLARNRKLVWKLNQQLERSELYWVAERTGFQQTCFIFWIKWVVPFWAYMSQ